MRLGMNASSVARVVEHCRWRRRSGERSIIPHVGPDPAGSCLALGQHRHRGVVAMQSFGVKHVALQAGEQWRQNRGASSHLVGQRRQADRHAFAGIALGPAVQRLMLPELLEQDHGQEARPGPAAGDDVKRRRRLADRLAVPARELLAYRLYHLPLPGNNLQRLGDILTDLAKAVAVAARTALRTRHHDAFTRQLCRKR